jgi:tetratricopeptide (TPR) repeat protein
MRRQAALVIAIAVAIPGVVAASGSSPMSPPTSGSSSESPSLTPEQQAIQYYNDGVSDRERADKLEAESIKETDAAKKAKLLEKSRRVHESAIKTFTRAVQNDPKMFQAWGGLGYAYRKTGNYPLALEAYDKALALKDSYTPAIEYRAEAYLGVNRLADVKTAYMTLFTADRPRADELAAAMEAWVEKRKADPAGVDPAAVDEFAKWVVERKQLASQTSSLRDPNAPRW